ncbi:MAG TPA: hypothetical protein VHR45_10030 [Thermoanaerobaculia bacterium]|nr:hypothetical protein [Thermoanaerobaculia bacterium]
MSSPFSSQHLVTIVRAAVAACWLILLVAAPVGAVSAAAAPKPLTNDDIVTMVQAGLPQEVIVEKIKTSKTIFDTSTDALVALKKAGVSGDIIRVMVNPAAEPTLPVGRSPWGNPNQPAPCQVLPGGQAPWLSGASPAMWYSEPDKGDRVEMNYERGTIAHVGFIFTSSLLVLHPIRASARVSGRAQFLSCINPTDAPLVHFSLDKGSDERNTSVGHIMPFHVSFHISDEDLVPFKFEKTPEGYFKITPNAPLQAGEYGFVPQESVGFFSAGERVYSFGVD